MLNYPPAFVNDPCPECGARELYDPEAFDPLTGWSTCLDPDVSCIIHGPTIFLVCRACHSALSVRAERQNALDGDCEGYYARRERIYTMAGLEFECMNRETLAAAPEEAPRCAGVEALMFAAAPDLAQAQHCLETENWPVRKLSYWLRAAIYYGQSALAEPLVRKGAPLAHQLAWALENRRVELALWLLAQGADPNDRALEYTVGNTCLPVATVEVAGMGALLTPTAFALAVATGAAPVLRQLLAQGVGWEPRVLRPKGYHPGKLFTIQEVAEQTGVLELLQGANND